VQEADWASEPVSTQRQEEKSSASAGNRTFDRYTVDAVIMGCSMFYHNILELCVCSFASLIFRMLIFMQFREFVYVVIIVIRIIFRNSGGTG
jgi:hypothetical protein